MRLSQYFMPILRDTPKEAEIVSHQLMLRAGMIRQESAGIYSWLPTGLRVLKKIEQIVREEQDASGALEVLMPTIQAAELWQERHAELSAAIEHEIDDFGSDFLGRTDEIALVLAIFGIHGDENFAPTQGVNRGFNARQSL